MISTFGNFTPPPPLVPASSAVVSLPLLPQWQFKVWQQQPSAVKCTLQFKPAHQSRARWAVTVASNICTTKERLADSSTPPPTPRLLHSPLPFPSTVTPPLLPLCSDPKSPSTPVTLLPSALISLCPLDWVLQCYLSVHRDPLTLHPRGHTSQAGLVCRPSCSSSSSSSSSFALLGWGWGKFSSGLALQTIWQSHEHNPSSSAVGWCVTHRNPNNW